MKTGSLTMSAVIPATAEAIYKAWMSAKGHAAMTGSPATVSARVGGKFAAWDGYIHGKTLELVPGKRIVQAWRSTEFPEGTADSRLEVTLARAKGGTTVTVKQTQIPAGQAASYRQGWKEFYFEPMKKYFGG
jgi:activator of HSP90 ATPase